MNDGISEEAGGAGFSRLEARLSAAFRRHADGISPSPDAYRRLVNAAEADSSSWRHRERVRPLSVAAATVALFGIGAVFLNRVGSQNVDTVAPVESAASAIGVDDDADMADPGAETDPGDGAGGETDRAESSEISAGGDSGAVGDDAASPGLPQTGGDEVATEQTGASGTVYAPVGRTRLEAAQGFLDLLGFDWAVPVGGGEQVAVHADAGGEPIPTGTTLLLEPQGSGFVVVEAISDQVEFVIEDGRTGTGTDRSAIVVGPTLSLIGRGSGADAVAIDVVSAGTGARLTGSSVATETGEQPAPFEVQLPLLGSDRGWVVARSSADTFEPKQSFAAQPVLFRGTPDPTDYTVVGLAPTDVDGGLVVRAEPAGERIGVIPLGSTGVRRRNEPPELVGRLNWMPITTANGLEGWVAAPYLAPDRDISTTTLVSTAARLAGRFTAGDVEFGPDLGVGRPFYVGTLERPMRLRGDVESPSIWTAGRAVMENGAPVKTRLLEFYRVEYWDEARILVPNGYLTTQAEASARSHFGSLPSVVIETTDPETGSRHRVHLFLSRPPDEMAGPGLRLHGILTESERPVPSDIEGTGDGASADQDDSDPTDPDADVDDDDNNNDNDNGSGDGDSGGNSDDGAETGRGGAG